MAVLEVFAGTSMAGLRHKVRHKNRNPTLIAVVLCRKLGVLSTTYLNSETFNEICVVWTIVAVPVPDDA
jgi:hypothetical protein